ncbi:MAG: hypothetical protein JWM10_4207, partial [Myxococcaceae bacterium]|nr:hypothetical protein [Myxococcaceae bacterium]
RVGPAGATFAGGGVSVVVPPGALDREVEIAIVPTTQPVPPGYLGYSVVYRATPEGQVFARPLVVSVEFAGDAARARLYWSRAAGGYESLGGAVAGNLLTASVSHFSSGFVGAEAADGGAPTDVPPAQDAAIDRPDAGAADAVAGDAGRPDVPPADAGHPDAGLPDAGLPDAGPPDAGPTDAAREACPATSPTEGGACAFLDLVCEYYGPEDDGHPHCRNDWSCAPAWPTDTTGRWHYSTNVCGGDVQACLSEPEMRAGAACTVGGLGRGYCVVPTGTCWCDRATGHYACDNPTATTGCPAHLPNLGAPCPAEGLACRYITALTRVCRRGLWRRT